MGTWSPEEHQAFVDRKRIARMSEVDRMPSDLRALVNEYGLPVIKSCLDLGVKKPRHIKHLVETILDEFSPTRGSYSQQGIRVQIDRE